MRLTAVISLILFTSIESSAQNAYVKMGQQAFLDGNFKAAVKQLEKGCMIDSTNANAYWMLGYSYYHSQNYRKSITSYDKVIFINPTDASAYYYRARAKGYMGKDTYLSPAEREKYLLGAIFDLTKAIAIDPSEKGKCLQTRGIAYREYAEFKLQPNTHSYDKPRAINSLKASIADLEKVINDNPNRADIATLIELSKEKLATAVGHH
ncbi:tetratricopeptide repeat protein [Mucilaginibacter achroorhodeus]|uniref:Tetratricopeptide repeat protein n=1 Tax=Mucilaginibacter achroorhodeus TaxID=2599294 RepID=A0A563U037_9SPHI|nr:MULTISPECIES: tetratricopeptide repeat protein [Mucilaginibacter]QXV65194.1 tetratricopeptide repeat protein [Mucilaginibacter sp. 21P]TWR23819.1 tetratricopeptide repeat protein [Mucilaginibacter achroorhodeus]